MDIGSIYESLTKLDGDEQIGLAYYRETGEYLDYIRLTFLKEQPNPCDFSRLHSKEAEEYETGLVQAFETRLSGSLNEQLFIEDGINAEIQHLPRYISIFPHRHDFFEIVCVICGRCLHRVEGVEAVMAQGDITVIPPNVHHYLLAEPDCAALTIKIRKSTFDSVFSALLQNGSALSAYFAQTLYSRHYRNSLTFHCGGDSFLPELLLHMFAQQAEKKAYYHHVLEGLLATFFPYLIQNYEGTIEFSGGDSALNERMIAIECYIRQNYKTATLTNTAQHFFLSPAYLSTMVKKQTGVTFSMILRQVRMERAAELLASTDLKVAQVCECVGYQDTTQFIRTFKQYHGMTPLHFRSIGKST